MANIALFEPYFSGSHRQWVEGVMAHSSHRIQAYTQPGRHWKWRMHGAALTLTQELLQADSAPDLLLVGSMIDLSTVAALLRGYENPTFAQLPLAIYFHENQLTYPWPENDPDAATERQGHFVWIQFLSALLADRVYFNSAYHRDSFLEALPAWLRRFPDRKPVGAVETIAAKSEVMHLGLDLARFGAFADSAIEWQEGVGDLPLSGRISSGEMLSDSDRAGRLVLWNHRWEYDKNPEAFFDALFTLADEGVAFQVAILGEQFRHSPEIFDEARARLGERVVQFGFAESAEAYAGWLRAADVLPVTSNQDFFGGSIIEAVHCGAVPILPRRLAYPEHFDGLDCFYETQTELVDLLRDRLQSPVDAAPYVERTRKYDWSVIAPELDRRLNGLIVK